MSKGIVIFAHNNRRVDYAKMSIISGGLAKKNLKLPVSLITDESTIEWMHTSNIFKAAEEIFDQFIVIDRPEDLNTRILHDGEDLKELVPFNNSNRVSAYKHTPYDQTLLIDSDYLILSNRLNNYWDLCEDILISESIKDLYYIDRMKYNDRYISETGIKMRWATAVMFNKSAMAELFFETINDVREHYEFFGDIYRFDTRQYRNDISFSISTHILSGFFDSQNNFLPPILTVLDKDVLIDVDKNKIKVLFAHLSDDILASFSDLDIHVMNKHSIVRNFDKFLETIK